MNDYVLKRAIAGYDPDRDIEEFGGAYGMRLADMMVARGIEKFAAEGDLEKIARVALIRFPELERGETIYDKEISNRLGQIRKAGYEVPSYSHLSKDEKWKLLRKIQGEVEAKVRERNPEVLREIYEENRRRIYESDFLR